MIRLDSTARKLQAVLGGAVSATEPSVITCYTDTRPAFPASFVSGTKTVATTGATAADICDAPEPLTTRNIDTVTLRNNDSASVTATIRYNDNGTTYKILTVTLLTLESLCYSGVGWRVLDASGNLKI